MNNYYKIEVYVEQIEGHKIPSPCEVILRLKRTDGVGQCKENISIQHVTVSVPRKGEFSDVFFDELQFRKEYYKTGIYDEGYGFPHASENSEVNHSSVSETLEFDLLLYSL